MIPDTAPLPPGLPRDEVAAEQTAFAGLGGWIVVPRQAARHSVVFFPHRTGLDPFIGKVTATLLAAGFMVALPDPFTGMPHGLAPEERKRRVIDEDMIAAAKDATAKLEDRLPGALAGALGFCMGGRLAFLAAAARTGIGRAACVYGGELDRGWHDPASPVQRVSAGIPPVQLHRGTQDSNATPEAEQAAVAAVAAVGGYLEAHVYAGARHAFANRFSPAFHPLAARRALRGVLDFLTDPGLPLDPASPEGSVKS